MKRKYLNFLLVAGVVLAGFLIYQLSKREKHELNEKVTAKIGYIPILDHFLLGVSKERDNASFSYLNLQPQKFTDYPTMSEAVRSGSLDGAILLAPLAFKLKQTVGVKIVSLAHRDGSALVVRVREGINSVQDLRGKTIAIPHKFSTNNFLLHLFTSQAGLVAEKDFKTIEIPPPQMFASLSTKSIDAFITAEPFISQAELSGVGNTLVLTSQIWKNHPDCLIILREDFMKKHPDACLEFITSITRSGIFVEENREEAVKIANRFLGGHTEEIMRHALSDKERVTYYRLTPEISELNRVQDYMAKEMGLFPQKTNLEKLVDTSLSIKAYEALKKEKSDLNK
jgi:NitT/TauT family transport system substrate-binding protein